MDQDGTWHGGGPWSRPHCARWRPSAPPQKGGRAPHFRPIFIVTKRLDASRCHCLSPGDFVLDGDPAPSPKRERSPQFSAYVYCGQTVACIKMPLYWYVGKPRPRRHCVRWGPSSPSEIKGGRAPPQFSAHVYCGQTAGWIKMALGTEVGLVLNNIVLDGDPAPTPKGRRFQFSANVYCGQTAA